MARAGRPAAGFFVSFSEIGRRRQPGAIISLKRVLQGAIEASRRPNQFAGARERNRPRPLTSLERQGSRPK